MEKLIDKYHCEYVKCCELLNQLTDELEGMQNGKSADYQLMLDIVTYLERQSDLSVMSEEQINSCRSDELNKIATLFYEEFTELKNLTHRVHDYIDAAIGDCMFEKEPFEYKLKSYIQKQRKHLDTGEFVILPILEEKLS
tara:strand:+ start:14497 stop:14916 length:420 start_codon:yes stop_codon:yes gene_type:complete